MSYTRDDLAYIWLSSIQGLSNRKKHALLSMFVSPRDILDCPLGEDATAFVGEEYALKLINCKQHGYLDDLVESLETKGITAIPYSSMDYPTLLKEIIPPPLVLYAKGDISLLNTPSIGVVGTRNCTKYGRDVTKKFTSDLASQGLTIVSGMARGLDAVAHETALSVGGKTIAVLATGVDVVYPSEHRSLYERIVKEGLVVSEYLPGTTPQTYQFPERNRIISGLCNGILVTEAGAHSGSLITLNYALEQNRDIFVVPGNVTSSASRGSNEAIRDVQCAIVLEANDILKHYRMQEVDDEPVSDVKLDVMEERVVEHLQKGEAHFDELLAVTGLDVPALNVLLTEMQLKGLVEKLKGNNYSI